MSIGGAGISGGGGSPQIDANALMELLSSAGGAQARIAEYQRAKQAYEKAYNDLKLGKSAQEAYDGVNAARDTAKKQIDAERLAFQKEMESAKKAHEDWLDKTKSDIAAKLKESNDKMKRADDLVGERQEAFNEAKRAEHRAVSNLQATERESATLEGNLRRKQAEAERALNDYKSLKAKYDDAINKIRSAISSI